MKEKPKVIFHKDGMVSVNGSYVGWHGFDGEFWFKPTETAVSEISRSHRREGLKDAAIAADPWSKKNRTGD